MFELLPLIVVTYLVFLILAASGLGLCHLLTRHDSPFGRLDLSLLFIPWLGWLSLMAVSSAGKSLSNAVAEPLFLGIAVAISSVMRLLPGIPRRKSASTVVTVVGLLFVAYCLWRYVPALPE